MNNIRFILRDMPTTVHGVVYHDEDGLLYILLNSKDSPVQQRRSARHELRHIVRGELDDKAYREYA